MPRIQTYNLDGNIQGNEKLLGTDGNNDTVNVSIDALGQYVSNFFDGRFLGVFTDLEALTTAFPNPSDGSFAHVDAGAGNPINEYIWDGTDDLYVIQQSSGVIETPSSIKTKYESNANTNALTDLLLSTIQDGNKGDITVNGSTWVINDDSITGAAIVDTTINAAAKLQNASITTDKISPQGTDGQVLTRAGSTVVWADPSDFSLDSTPTDGSTNGVTSNGVFDALVGINSFLNNGSVSGEKIADTTINGNAKIQNASITGDKIASNAINQDKVSDNAIGVNELDDSQTSPPSSGQILSYNGSNLEWVDKISYETNSFSPTLVDGGGGATYTYTLRSANYTKIGNQVTFSIYISDINTTGTPSGQFRIEGMPYGLRLGDRTIYSVQMTGSSLDFYSVSGLQIGTSTSISFNASTGLNGSNTSSFSSVSFSNGLIVVTGTYLTS